MMKRNSNIPKFDLGQQILVEQRKASSVKRKAPKAAKIKPKTAQIENVAKTIIESKPIAVKQQPLSNPDHIIAEIVARDIMQLRSR